MLDNGAIREIEAYIGYIKENKLRRKKLDEEMKEAKAEVVRIEDELEGLKDDMESDRKGLMALIDSLSLMNKRQITFCHKR